MHIPDSAISPATSLAAGAAMVPVWYLAGRRLRAELETRATPLLALGAAFCFTIMMFNIPVPGGTTVHPVGAVLMAVLLGPWAAVLGVTVALVIQALFFADGGVFAIGANCFSMALAMPVCGYLAYRVAAGRSAERSTRRALAAGVGAYVGINAAALVTAILLGIQPALYHDPAGRALYFPFGLAVTLPAILASHMTVAGIAETAVTVVAVRYLQAAGLPLYAAAARGVRQAPPRAELLWVSLAALLALAPVGLLATGEAWGEWSPSEVARRAGYLPARLGHVDRQGWHGLNLLPDYLGDRGPLAYVLAGALGILLVAAVLAVAARLLTRRSDARTDGASVQPPPDQIVDPTPRAGGLPSWLVGEPAEPGSAAADRLPDEGERPCRRARSGHIEHTLAGLAGGARDALFGERWQRRNGLLQRLDPRAKVLCLLGFVVLTSCVRHLPMVLCLLATVVVLAAASRLPARLLLQRAWLPLPLFAGAVLLPSALNIVTPGRPVAVLLHEPYLAVTQPGLAAVGLLTLRIGAAVSFVVLLTLTTRWNDLLAALRVLLVPRPFVVVLAMTYRYLGVLMKTAAEMFEARMSRSVGHTPPGMERRFLGGAIGSLFGRTLALTEDVHGAMLSRGWTGQPRTLRPMRMCRSDVLWVGAMALTALLVLGGEILG